MSVKIKETQWIKNTERIVQVREIGCDEWEEYINHYILRHESNHNIVHTFHKRSSIAILNMSNGHVYAEYVAPYEDRVICHESKIIN